MKRKKIILFCMIAVAGICFSCNDGNESEDPYYAYDPAKPTMLISFYPDSGVYQEKVMLIGENLPINVEDVKVYFNHRPAAVIGSTGKRMYVQAPRLPGDTCVISVVVGNDSLIYPDPFYYFTSVSVTTIAGNGTPDFRDGDLSNSQFAPRYICVDKDDNVFVATRNIDPDGHTHICRIDERNNELIAIAMDVTVNVPAADPETGAITLSTETTIGSYYSLDPQELWAPRIREARWPEGVPRPDNGWKHCMVVNPTDGYIYTRYYYGQVVKINPQTFDLDIVTTTPQGDSYGMTFNPLYPGILFIAMWSNGGEGYANSIFSLDINDPDPASTIQRLTSPISSGGHRDGEISIAQFRNPSQIFCDNDGNMYVADSDNHCIRRITPELMVETVLGMPGTTGWKDGGRQEALFRNPRGVGIAQDGSVYVADNGNNRVRKLSIN
ncbi:MAG: IPT/TIG domain-containing protein [Tannerella sp.]|jgi:streptogramin lyase|nr:IPT/TIG domain-containing protein [Tannerella sp.]